MKHHDLCAGKATLDFNIVLKVARNARAQAAQALREALNTVCPDGWNEPKSQEENYRNGIRREIVAQGMEGELKALAEANETVHILEAMFNRPEFKWKNHPCSEYKAN